MEIFEAEEGEEIPNIQVYSKPIVTPTEEEKSIRLTIVDTSEGTKEYVVIEALTQFINRHNKFVEFFTIRQDSLGTKVGVSLEWVKRDEVYLRGHTTDKEIEKLTEPTKTAFNNLAMTGKPQEIDLQSVREEKEQ
jgi:hypothetical protein